MNKVIVAATPVFLALIAIEFAWGWRRGRNTYRLHDAISSISLGMLSQVSGVFQLGLRIGLYALVWRAVGWGAGPGGEARHPGLWNGPAGWLLALLFYDFCYYWLHRAGHEVALLWAAHAVHHQSEDYNLSTALRQTSSGHVLGWIFYLPLALAGVPPVLFGIVALVDLLYQFWVHTEHVPKLGWFDRWFCSPSNHRVHHAVNERYLDRNYGGILVIWDRLFGSFQEELDAEPCVYGTRDALRSWDPLWANLAVYADRARDCWETARWQDKLLVWWRPAGWRPADVAARRPRPAFELAQVQRWDPPLSRALMIFGALGFVALLNGVALFLWTVDELPPLAAGLSGLALVAATWLLNAVLQRRLAMLEGLALLAAVGATLGAVLGWQTLHLLNKPAVMVLALAWVASAQREAGGLTRRGLWLLAALACSCVGDVLLMLSGPQWFVPGLVAFLLAHLAYVRLFRFDSPWLPRRWALAFTTGMGGGIYAVLLMADLPGPLRAPVALYVGVIALMTAQALGRAAWLAQRARESADPAARTTALLALGVAGGALSFMASDTLLALNRFVEPLPLASLWVLASYFLAQWLIVRHLLPGLVEEAAAAE